MMRANPTASLANLIRLGRRPRTSTMASLRRLEEAGLVEHPGKGVYTAVGPDLIETPKPKSVWVEPLSGKHVARHAAGSGPRRDDDGVRRPPETAERARFWAANEQEKLRIRLRFRM
jgi:hypothetical protein